MFVDWYIIFDLGFVNFIYVELWVVIWLYSMVSGLCGVIMVQ